MRILGFEIRRAVKETDSLGTEARSSAGVLRLGSGILPKMITGEKKRVLDQFVFPMIDTGDDWQVMALNRYKKSLLSMLGGYYDVCGLNQIKDDLGIALTPSTMASYTKLRNLHCVNFSLMPESIYRQIPHLANHVISEGTVVHSSIQPNRVIDV